MPAFRVLAATLQQQQARNAAWRSSRLRLLAVSNARRCCADPPLVGADTLELLAGRGLIVPDLEWGGCRARNAGIVEVTDYDFDEAAATASVTMLVAVSEEESVGPSVALGPAEVQAAIAAVPVVAEPTASAAPAGGDEASVPVAAAVATPADPTAAASASAPAGDDAAALSLPAVEDGGVAPMDLGSPPADGRAPEPASAPTARAPEPASAPARAPEPAPAPSAPATDARAPSPSPTALTAAVTSPVGSLPATVASSSLAAAVIASPVASPPATSSAVVAVVSPSTAVTSSALVVAESSRQPEGVRWRLQVRGAEGGGGAEGQTGGGGRCRAVTQQVGRREVRGVRAPRFPLPRKTLCFVWPGSL